MQLLQNDQGGDFRDLEVFPGKSAQDHTLAEIVIHASIAIQCVGSGSLTEPLYMLMTYPQSMVVISFFNVLAVNSLRTYVVIMKSPFLYFYSDQNEVF